jgi:hypothetical protein
LNRFQQPELPNLNDGDQCQALLEEIQTLMQRSKGYYFWGPNLGRIGCGAISAGFVEMFRFKIAADRHNYLKTAVQEYYLFDPVHDNGPSIGAQASNLKIWASTDPNRRIRVYNNESSPAHDSFVGRSLPAAPFVEDNGRLTAGVIPDQAMRQVRAANHFITAPIERMTTGTGVYTM